MSSESDYENIKIIGKGSHGSVFLVRYVKHNETQNAEEYYVLKKIPIKDCDAVQKAATFQEVELLKSLTHPYIVNYRSSYTDAQGNLCIVMEYCGGGDLSTKIHQQSKTGKGFSEKQILEWFVQMTQALEYIHEVSFSVPVLPDIQHHKILHRDIKTQNIFLDSSNAIKLGDFGIARTLGSTQEMARTMVGTPYYMSPEIFTGKPYNYKSDIWALGCCLYEMITFKQAFDAKDMTTLVTKVLKGTFPPIPTHYNPQLTDLLKLLLNRVPSKRPSCSTILKHPYIKKFIENHSHTSSIPPSIPTPTNTNNNTHIPSTEKSNEASNQKENVKNASNNTAQDPPPSQAAPMKAPEAVAIPTAVQAAESRRRRHSLKEAPRRNSIEPSSSKAIVELTKRKPKRSIEPSQLAALRQEPSSSKAAPLTPQKVRLVDAGRPKNRQVEALNRHKSRLSEARSPRVSAIPVSESSPPAESVDEDAMDQEESKQITPPAEPKQSMFTFIPLHPAPSTPSKPPLAPSTPRSTPQSKVIQQDNNRNRRDSLSMNPAPTQKSTLQTKNGNPIRAMFERNNKLQPGTNMESCTQQTSPSRGEDFPVYECINANPQDIIHVMNSPLIYKQKTKRVRDQLEEEGPQKMQHLPHHEEDTLAMESEEADMSDEDSSVEDVESHSPFLDGNLSQRIKTITQHCIDGLGRDMFYRVKHFMIKEANEGIIDKQLKEWLGDLRTKQFQPLVAQLIFCEESLQ